MIAGEGAIDGRMEDEGDLPAIGPEHWGAPNVGGQLNLPEKWLMASTAEIAKEVKKLNKKKIEGNK